MMAVVFVRILAELACMLAAVTVVPGLYLMGDKSGAIGALMTLYFVGNMAGPNHEDKMRFDEFQRQRGIPK